MDFQDVLLTVFSSLGLVGVIAIGIWVGTIQTKVQNCQEEDDKIDNMFEQIQTLLREMSERIARIEGKLGI